MNRGWMAVGGMALGVAALAGCQDRAGGRAFSPRPTPLPAGTTLAVDGPATLPPGGSAQYRATLVEASGERRDVTAEAEWTLRGFGLSVSPTGLVAASDLGFATMTTSFGPAYTTTEVAALPAGTFVVSGRVTPLIDAAPGRVEILDGPHAGRAVTADRFGEYWLVGVAGPLRLRATMLGHAPEVRALTVGANHEADFVLTAPAVASPDGRWRLAVSTAPGCAFEVRDASAMLDVAVTSSTPYLALRITAPGENGPAPLLGTLTSTVFAADFYWGDFIDYVAGLRLADPAVEVWGDAVGVASDRRITGTITGRVIDRRQPSAGECDGEHAFVMTKAEG